MVPAGKTCPISFRDPEGEQQSSSETLMRNCSMPDVPNSSAPISKPQSNGNVLAGSASSSGRSCRVRESRIEGERRQARDDVRSREFGRAEWCRVFAVIPCFASLRETRNRPSATWRARHNKSHPASSRQQMEASIHGRKRIQRRSWSTRAAIAVDRFFGLWT
jgi:hypothetical protein